MSAKELRRFNHYDGLGFLEEEPDGYWTPYNDAKSALDAAKAEIERLKQDAARWNGILARHSYALVTTVIPGGGGYSSDKARGQIEAWADAAIAEVAAYSALSPEEKDEQTARRIASLSTKGAE